MDNTIIQEVSQEKVGGDFIPWCQLCQLFVDALHLS